MVRTVAAPPSIVVKCRGVVLRVVVCGVVLVVLCVGSLVASGHLYKILFYFEPLWWESIILLCPPPPSCKAYPIAILLHDHCAIYPPHHRPLFNAKHNPISVMAISCKGRSECVGGDMLTPTACALHYIVLLRGLCAGNRYPCIAAFHLYCPHHCNTSG